MKPLKNLRNERGQGLMEYTLIVFLVALVFWGGMRSTNIGDELQASWSKVVDCITTPFLLRFVISSADQELACSI